MKISSFVVALQKQIFITILKIPQLGFLNSAEVNAQDEDGQTALHYACSIGYESVIQTLLEASADKTISDSEGLKPIDVIKNDEIKANYFL